MSDDLRTEPATPAACLRVTPEAPAVPRDPLLDRFSEAVVALVDWGNFTYTARTMWDAATANLGVVLVLVCIFVGMPIWSLMVFLMCSFGGPDRVESTQTEMYPPHVHYQTSNEMHETPVGGQRL